MAAKRRKPAIISTVFGTAGQVEAQKKYVEDHTTIELSGKKITLGEYKEMKKEKDTALQISIEKAIRAVQKLEDLHGNLKAKAHSAQYKQKLRGQAPPADKVTALERWLLVLKRQGFQHTEPRNSATTLEARVRKVISQAEAMCAYEILLRREGSSGASGRQ